MRVQPLITGDLMRVYDIIKIEENGIIKLPDDIATEIGIVKGAYLLVEADERSKELTFERIAVPGKNLAEITLVLQDKPGVLADVALELGNADINILFNESDEIRFSNLSALLAIVDMSRSRIPVDELKSHFEKMKVVKKVEIRQIG
jgi:acetolactate synthase-1/3 small subunit